MSDLLSITGLRVSFPGRRRPAPDGVDLAVAAGEAVALVGPSGSGKSLTARAALGLLPPTAKWSGGIRWKGARLTDPSAGAWAAVRGRGMTLVLQEPLAALDPVRTVGDQIAETVGHHQGIAGAAAARRAVELLGELAVPDPARVAGLHPHRLSGGLRQRALIAAALACDPELLIADEPTTALDVIVQKGILETLARVREDRKMGLLFISHDQDLVDLVADRVVALDAQEDSPPRPRPAKGPPDLSGDGTTGSAPALLTATDLRVDFGRGRRRHAVLRGVDLELRPGEAVGLAGRSGCGKTTLARVLSGHLAATGGEILLSGERLTAGSAADFRRRRRRIQLLFQDPGSSLDPRQTVLAAVAEAGAGARAAAALAEVGLDAAHAARRPHGLSGGQRQRAALARSLAADPAVLIADEPTSSLDHAARDRVLDLLADVRCSRRLALVVISHDLAVLERACDRVVVMLDGHIVEVYPVGGGGPRHPYTRELWAASPAAKRHAVEAIPPGRSAVGSGDRETGRGCPYASACGLWKPRCSKGLPELSEVAERHVVRCPEVEDPRSSQFIDTY